MRVLLTVNPEKSIFQYLVPLMWALRTAGHEVRVASQPGFAKVITQAGLTAVAVGRDQDQWRTVEAKPEARAAVRAGLLEPYDVADFPEKATWEYLQAGFKWNVTWWHKMDNFPMIADLVSFARAWKPDLVIWEPLTFAGAIAAKACGAAHARFLFGVDVFGTTRDHFLRLQREQPPEDRGDAMADWLGANATKYGTEFSEDMITGHFTIDQFPPSLQEQAELHYVPVRYVPYGGPAVVPKWLWAPPERPRVALTLGLSAIERFDGYAVGVQDVLDSLSDLDIELVATISEAQQAKLERVPDNARLVPYVPLQALSATCSAIIHHAGAATMATVSLDGLPQLALPFHHDQPALGRMLAAHGAGLTLDPDHTTGQTVRDSLLRLLEEPSFRRRAEDLRTEMLAMPSPNDIVDTLEELTVKYRNST